MVEIADDKRLELKLTQYGLDRITQAMEQPDLTLALTKIKLGSGRNNEYYVPTENELANPNFDLQGPLRYEFYIYNKELLEDGLTVSFRTVIPEDVGGFDIREVGLYETVDGEDKLFAIAVQQPIVKPSPDYNYFININYYIFLKAQNLADVYDRIVLDVEHAEVSEADLESLMRNFLFAQENLMVQIGKNSELIGYNRSTQILDKVNENKQDYSYITLYKNFASVLDLVKSSENIFSYWAFDYSRRMSLSSSIVNLANTDSTTYLSTNIPISSYPHKYDGFQSMFTFEGSNSYYLPSNIPVDLYDPETNKDRPLTMVFAVEPIAEEFNKTRTLLAKSDRSNGAVVFEVQELDTKELQVRFYNFENGLDCYLEFKSTPIIPNSPHSLVLTYDPDAQQMVAYVNSKSYLLQKTEKDIYNPYVHMNPSASGKLYKFTSNPVYSCYVGQNNYSEGYPYSEYTRKVFCNENGYPIYLDRWIIDGDDIKFDGNDATPGTPIADKKLYAWGHWPTTDTSGTPQQIIYLQESDADSDGYPTSEDIPIFNERFEQIEDSNYTIIPEGSSPSGFTIVYGDPNDPSGETQRLPQTDDITRVITPYSYTATEVIYSTATSFTDNTHPLYESPANDTYIIYTGDLWKFIPNDEENPETYSLCFVDYGITAESTVDPNPVEIKSPNLTSYIIKEDGLPGDYCNSSVGLISIIKERLSNEDARVLALNLCAIMGKNPFLDGD